MNKMLVNSTSKYIKYPFAKSFVFLLLTFIISIIGCNTTYNDEIKTALKQAGSNKKELKKVLSYYNNDPSDSLKYKAACFLIENMRWHYGNQIEPSKNFWNLFVMEDSLIKSYLQDPDYYKNEHGLKGYKYGVKKFLVHDAIANSTISQNFVSDLQKLNAEEIIENIDNAFIVKDNWKKNVPQNNFYEYILPYRVNNEPVYPMRQKLRNHFSVLNEVDSLKGNMIKTISYLNEYMRLFFWDYAEEHIKMPDLGFYNIFYWHNKSLTCSHQVAVLSKILRSIGIPVTEVFTPTWRSTNLGHSWCGLPIKEDSLVLFTPVYQNPGEVYLPHSPSRASKIYMKTFGAQEKSPYYLKSTNEELPTSFRNPCIKDITHKFVDTRNVEVKLNQPVANNNLCWFSIFIQGRWKPVGWGTINKEKGTVNFENIPSGLTGIACVIQNGEIIPCSPLFMVKEKNIKYITPADSTQKLLLTRKFPVKTRMQYFIKEMTGTRIQGANNADFSDSVSLFTIKDTLKPYYQDITFENTHKYKYYRLFADSWHLHIAELEFITEDSSSGTTGASLLPVFDEVKVNPNKYYKYRGKVISNEPDSAAFDGNMLTYTTKKWTGMEFERPVRINRIRVAPRNAHNEIVRGDNYKLFYWDNTWIPLTTKKANQNFIIFDEVPSNTVYWLRNIDHGKEEQPFFYMDNKQVFSNY